MNRKLFTFAILTASFAVQVNAGDFPLKNRSTFAADDGKHNPFWPIGWAKTAVATSAPAVPAPLVKPGDFVVTSILLNQPPIAVINGKEMVEGEVVAMNFGGQKVNVQLAAVQDGQVVLRYRDQNLVVPLRRREIKPFGGPTATR